MTSPPRLDDQLTLRVDPDEWAGIIARHDGPQLVVAGPGTGKTELLVRRAIDLVASGAASPAEVLVLTFSRRAAGVLRRRINQEVKAGAVEVSTFHSFAHWLLEAHGPAPQPTLLTGPEQVALVAHLLRSEDPDKWAPPFRDVLGVEGFAEEVADFVLRCRERLLSPDDLTRVGRPEWRSLPGFLARYDRTLAESGRLDYATLVVRAIVALEDGDLRRRLPCRYVLVDEYQDTSPAQARLLELLTASHRNLTVAGDPYQSIYSFRGAHLGNVAEFARRFRAADGAPGIRIVLTTSLRVPAPIMDAALRVTASGELPGSAGRVRPAPHPGRVDAHVFDQQTGEAEWIASEIERLTLEEGMVLSDIAVLLRSKRRLLPELSRALDRRGIPHDRPDARLVDHPAVRAVLDLACAARCAALGACERVGPDHRADAGVVDPARLAWGDIMDRAVRRVLLGPLVRLTVGTEREAWRVRRRSGTSWGEVIRRRLPAAAALAELLENPAWATEWPATDGFWHVWEHLDGFAEMVTDPARGEERAALAAFAQTLARQADRDPSLTLTGFLALADGDDFEATPLLTSAGGDQVTLTTLHQAKGLEFEVVFIADAAEGVFPDTSRPRSLLQPHLLAEGATDDPGSLIRFRLQEEMRLAYTAMTRARRRVVWTATQAGIDEGGRRPSRFLLAAAGVTSVDRLPPPPLRTGDPVSPLELEALLRRTLADPGAPAASRLAAATVLSEPGPSTHTGSLNRPGAHPSSTPALAGPWDASAFAGAALPGPDIGLATAQLRLSPSQAEAYELCPRRYAFERRLRLDDRSSPYASFGTLVHAALERAESAALERGVPRSRRETAAAAFDNLISAGDFGTPVLADAWRRRGHLLLERLYAEWPAHSGPVVRTEHTLRLEVGGVEWIGRADRIERTASGGLRVVDYKTAATPPTAAEAASSLQLGFYLLAASADPRLATEGPVEGAEVWHPLTDRKRWWFPFDPAHLASVVDRLERVAAAMAAEEWAPRVGAHCRGCRFRIACERWPEGREAFTE